MNGKISNAFSIRKGTEQGHPLSPELIKVYFKELSDLLNSANTNNPTLSGLTITHLAWADDLFILALDMKLLQKQLDIIESYCSKWGLEINKNKTIYLIFNANRNNRSYENCLPTLNGTALERVTSYCYLGIIICDNGNFKTAITSLSSKGLGALFSLQRTVDRRITDPKCIAIDQLFNTLVAPILMYGCQIWLPVSPLIKSLTKGYSRTSDNDKLINLLTKEPYERILLRHTKYLLGINRRSSNSATLGETGRFPLVISSIRLCINYFKRTINLDDATFVKAALNEQIRLDLTWYSGIKGIITSFNNINPRDYEFSTSPTHNALMMSDLCSHTPGYFCKILAFKH